MHCKHPVPLVDRDLLERCEVHVARGVQHAVDPAEPLHGLVDRALDGVLVGDVAGDPAGTVQLLRHRPSTVAVEVDDGCTPALRGEATDGGRGDPGPASCGEQHLAGESLLCHDTLRSGA